jgi:hypothetical protein
MIKKFSELTPGDRVLLVYPDGHTRAMTCLTNPLKPNAQLQIGSFLSTVTGKASTIIRDRNFPIPVFARLA